MRLRISKLKFIIWKSPINKMSVTIYIITQAIQIIHLNEITQYTNVAIEQMFYNSIISHINEKVTKSYKFNY